MKKAWVVAAAAAIVVWTVPSHADALKGRITSVNEEDGSFQMTHMNRETMSLDVVRVAAGQGLLKGLDVGDAVRVEAEGGQKGGAFRAVKIEAEAGDAIEEGGAPPVPQSDATLSARGVATPSGSTGSSSGAEIVAAESGDPSLE